MTEVIYNCSGFQMIAEALVKCENSKLEIFLEKNKIQTIKIFPANFFVATEDDVPALDEIHIRFQIHLKQEPTREVLSILDQYFFDIKINSSIIKSLNPNIIFDVTYLIETGDEYR